MLWEYSINGNLPSYRAQLAHQTSGLVVSEEAWCLPLVTLTVELSPSGAGGWGWWRELVLRVLGTFLPSERYKNQGCVVSRKKAGVGGQTRGLGREEHHEANIS